MTKPSYSCQSFVPALSWFVVKSTILRDPNKIREAMDQMLSLACDDCKCEFTDLVLTCFHQIMSRLTVIDPSADAVFDEVLDEATRHYESPGGITGVTIAVAVASDPKNAVNLVGHASMEGIFEQTIIAVCEIFARFYNNAALDNDKIHSEMIIQLSTLNENIQSWVDQNGYE